MALKTRAGGFAIDEPMPASNLTPQPIEPRIPTPKKTRVSKVAPSREGLVQFGFFVSPEARRQIRGWAGLNGRTTQDIGDEMMNDWCRKHGLHRLAKS